MTTGLMAKEFLELVIRPTLVVLAKAEPRLKSAAAECLLLGTAIYESDLRHMVQKGGGPALSLFQIEPRTAVDICNWLTWNTQIHDAVDSLCIFGSLQIFNQYAGNQHLACALARVLYWRISEPLPAPDDISGLSHYYKKYYNTSLGAGSPDKWASTYRSECAGLFNV